MNPQIIFLGTAGDSAVAGKQTLGTGGIVIQTQDNQFHIDPGPGATVRARMYGVNNRETTAVLISNGHLIHANDTNAILSAMSHNGLDSKGVLIAAESVIKGKDNIPKTLSELHHKFVEKVIIARRDQRVGIETTEIQVLPTTHSDLSGVGFKLYTPNFVLTYTGETKYDKELVEYYKKSDIIILNITYPSGTTKRDGLSSDDAIKILKQTKPTLAILTHFGTKMLAADILSETRKVQQEVGIQVIAAKDGMKVNPDNYSSKLKTRTLNLFKKRD